MQVMIHHPMISEVRSDSTKSQSQIKIPKTTIQRFLAWTLWPVLNQQRLKATSSNNWQLDKILQLIIKKDQ